LKSGKFRVIQIHPTAVYVLYNHGNTKIISVNAQIARKFNVVVMLYTVSNTITTTCGYYVQVELLT